MRHLACQRAGITRRGIARLFAGIAGLSLGFAMTSTAGAQTASAVEYYYDAWDYYFVTAFPGEIAALDGGAFNGNWKRTGESFVVDTQPSGSATETCRFFS